MFKVCFEMLFVKVYIMLKVKTCLILFVFC